MSQYANPNYALAKPYEDRYHQPASSIYITSSDAPLPKQLSCMYCKRTLCSIKGDIDKIISTPMPAGDFLVVIDIKCKTCKQMWRLCIVAGAEVVIASD